MNLFLQSIARPTSVNVADCFSAGAPVDDADNVYFWPARAEMFESEGYAQKAASWLIGQAEPCLEDGTGLNWPLGSEGSERRFHWCHGPAGIGLFFLRAWLLTGNATYRDVASAAACTVSESGR